MVIMYRLLSTASEELKTCFFTAIISVLCVTRVQNAGVVFVVIATENSHGTESKILICRQ